LYLSKRRVSSNDSRKEQELAENIEASFISEDDVLYAGGQAERKKSSKNKDGGTFGFLSSIFGGKNRKNQSSEGSQQRWRQMSEEEKRERIKELWDKARRYNNKLRFQARLQKMAESNLKEMMIDDINNDETNEANQSDSNQAPKLKWYLIDTERTFCKTWNFMITLMTIYNMFLVPFILVFPHYY